jgi:hypothetical protein
MGIFNDDDMDPIKMDNEIMGEEQDDGQYLVDITKPIQKPMDFDTLCALVNHYEEMETIVNDLSKHDARLKVDTNPNDEAADMYNLDRPYADLLIKLIQGKMQEIRNILNYN